MDVKILVSFLTSLVITIISGPLVIPVLKRLKFGQSIRNDGPSRHLQKSGTPTMGGIMFLSGILVSGLWLASASKEALLVLGIILAFGFIGFLDDFIKVVLKRPLGLRAREKLLGQVLFSTFVVLFCVFSLGRGTDLVIPYSGLNFELGTWGFFIFAILVITGTANAVNLTDGLDGLAAGISALVALSFILITLALGSSGLAVLMAGVAGGCLGFLFYNHYPARVFMGDTGSLALGGALGATAVVTRTELFMLIIGGVFVLETLSVILQVLSFQLLGRRLFRMSPLHHHFELCNWSEKKIVVSFWAATAFFAALGLLGFYKTM